MDQDEASTVADPDGSRPADATARRGIPRRWGLRAAVALLVALGASWVIVATGLGMEPILRAVLRAAAPEGFTVELADARGDWRSSIEVRDVTVTGPGTRLTVARIELRYGLASLLRRRVQLEALRVDTPALSLDPAQRPASDEEEAVGDPRRFLGPSPLGRWSVDVGELALSDGSVVVQTAEGAWRAASVGVRGGLRLGAGAPFVELDSIGADVRPPSGSAEGRPAVSGGRLKVAARLDGRLVHVDTVSFVSDRSEVAGSGSIALVPSGAERDTLRFELHARPLDLRDLPIDVPPALADDPTLRLAMSATGVSDSVFVELDVAGPAETSAALRALLRAGGTTATEPALRASASFSVPSPGRFAPAASGGALHGTIDVVGRALDSTTGLWAEATLYRSPDGGVGGPSAGLRERPLRADVHVEREVPAPSGEPAPLDVVLSVRVTESVPPPGTVATLPEPVQEPATAVVRAASPSVRAAARLTPDGRASWRLDARVGAGEASAEGTALWQGERPEAIVDRLVLDRVDPSALDPGLPTASLTARARGRYAGRGLGDGAGRVEVELVRSAFGEATIDSVFVGATLQDRVATGSAWARAAGIDLVSDFHVTVGDTAATGRLTGLHVRRGGPRESATAETVPDGLDGRVDFRWTLGGEVRRGSAEAVLDSAAVGPVRLGASTLRARLDGDSLTGDGRVLVPDVMGSPVAARASLALAGLDPSTAVGTLRVEAARTAVAGQSGASGARDLGRDTLTLSVVAEEPGVARLQFELGPALGGRLVGAGTGRYGGARTSLDLVAGGALVAPSSLLDGATVDSVAIQASVTVVEGSRPEGTVRVELRNGSWREIRIDSATAGVRSTGDALRIDTLAIRANVASLDGAGSLPVTGSDPGGIRISAEVANLEPVQRMLGRRVLTAGAAAGMLTASGRLDSMEVAGSARVGALVVDEMRLAGLEVTVAGRLEPGTDSTLTVVGGRLDTDLDRLGIGEVEIRRVRASVGGGPDSVRIEGSALVDDDRRGDLVVRVDPRPEARMATVERLDLSLDRDLWRLARPAQVSYGDAYVLRDFLLRAGGQEIRAEGSVHGSDSLDVTVDVDSTDIGTISDLVGLPGLQGWIGGQVRLSGRPRAPVGTVDVDGAFHRAGNRPAPVHIGLESDGRRVTADVEAVDVRRGTLRLDGSVSLPTRAAGDVAAEPGPAELALEIRADSFALGWALPFVDPATVSALDGRMDGRLRLGGTTTAPALGGALALRGGVVGLRPLGVRLESLDVFLRGDGARIVVDSADVASGGGTLRVSGSVSTAEELPLDLAVRMQSFEAIRNRQYDAVVSGDLRVSGSAVRPIVAGGLGLQSLDVYLDERVGQNGIEEVTLTEEDLQMLRERFGYVPPRDGPPRAPLGDRLTADLVVELSRDSWLRSRANPEMAVAFTGEVDVRLRPGEVPFIEGSVETIPGRGFVEQFGRRFQLREGDVVFAGPADSTRVDLSATYTIPSRDNPDDAEATIVLQVEGTSGALTLTLSSEPEMENADIVSYIATGRPASGSLSFGEGGPEGGLVGAGADLALGQVVSVVEGAAERSIGLDVVEIRREGVRGATLVAGKYVSPRLYVGFAQPVSLREREASSPGGGGGDSQVEIELEALRWLLLNVQGSGSALDLFLRVRHAY